MKIVSVEVRRDERHVVEFKTISKKVYKYDRKTRVLYRLWKPTNGTHESWQEVENGHTIAILLTNLSKFTTLYYRKL